MPKIAYEIGIDPQRKVTKEWIQEKLNSVKALLQGRIDTENLCANSQKQLLKTVKDRPTEVIAFDNSMKFFKKDGDSDEFGKRTPVVDLFMELVNLCNASPDVAVVGGTLDSEMVSTFTTEDSAADGSDTQTSYTDVVTKDLEVPPNYIPMTWGELADLVAQSSFELTEIQMDLNTGELSLAKKTGVDDRKQYILENVFNADKNNYAYTLGYSVNWSKSKTDSNYYTSSRDSASGWGVDVYAPVIFPEFGLPDIKFEEEANNLKLVETIQFFKSLAKIKSDYSTADDYKYTKSSGATTVRLIPEFLCKVV